MAFTTTILNSSPISAMKDEICFIKRSIELSLPVRDRGRLGTSICVRGVVRALIEGGEEEKRGGVEGGGRRG